MASLAAICYLGLVVYLFLHPDLPEQSDTMKNVVLTTYIILAGPMAGFVLFLFRDRANLRVTFGKYALTTSGGYAIVIFSLYMTAPGEKVIVRVIELHEKSKGIKFEVDLVDAVVDGKGVAVEGLKKAGSSKDYMLCKFSPAAKSAQIKFSLRASNIPYIGSIKVTRKGEVEELGYYTAEPDKTSL